MVVETENMAVRAYLGSVDINDARRFGHVDMISALRSPGSTLKPFLYGMAMDAGAPLRKIIVKIDNALL